MSVPNLVVEVFPATDIMMTQPACRKPGLLHRETKEMTEERH